MEGRAAERPARGFIEPPVAEEKQIVENKKGKGKQDENNLFSVFRSFPFSRRCAN